MKNDIIIRRFEEKDLDDVHETIAQALETAAISKVYEPEKLEIWHESYSKKCILGLSKLRHLYVADLDGKVVGCAAVSYDESKAFVSCVYINNNYQGMGIGRKLITALENDEISQKTKKMFLHAVLTAKKFYEKMGFHIEGDFPEITDDNGVEVVLLIKEL